MKRNENFSRRSLPVTVLLIIALFIIPACALSSAIASPTTVPPTDTLYLTPTPPPPTATSTARPSSPTPLPSPTEVPPSATPLPPTAASPAIPFVDLSMADALNGWATASQSDGNKSLLRTADGGLTWKDVTPRDDSLAFDSSVSLDAQTAWCWLRDPATSTYRLVRTTDGGGTWKTMKDAITDQYDRTVFSTATNGQGLIWTIKDGQINAWLYATKDGGATWKQVMLTTPSNINPPFDKGALHLCDPCGDTFTFDPLRLVIIKGNDASEPSSNFFLDISLDGGKTWQIQAPALPAGMFEKSWIGFSIPVFLDENNGWLPLRVATSNKTHFAFAFYRTSDGGLTWTFQSFLETGVAAQPQFLSTQDAFAVRGNQLYVTHDGTKTWEMIKMNPRFALSGVKPTILQYDFIDLQTGWVLEGEGGVKTALWQTTDGGLNWTLLTPVLEP